VIPVIHGAPSNIPVNIITTSTLSEVYLYKYGPQSTSMVGNVPTIYLPAITSDTYLTVLTDNEDFVTYTTTQTTITVYLDENRIPESVTVGTHQGNQGADIEAMEAIISRMIPAQTVNGTVDVVSDCRELQYISGLAMPTVALNYYNAFNGNMTVITKDGGTIVLPKSAMADFAAAIHNRGSSSQYVAYLLNKLTQDSIPEIYSGCTGYSLVVAVSNSAAFSDMTILTDVIVSDPITVTIPANGETPGSFIIVKLGFDGSHSVVYPQIVGDEIVFQTDTLGMFIITDMHALSWESAGSVNTNMKVYAGDAEIQSGSPIPTGTPITIVPSEGFAISSAYYNGTSQMTYSKDGASFYMPNQDTTLKVTVLEGFTVTFDLSGKGNPFTKTYLDGNRLGKVDAKALGFILEGWYLDKELTKEFKADNVVTGNMRLYAKWAVDPGHTSGKSIDLSFSGELSDEQISSAINQMKEIRSQGMNPFLTLHTESGRIHINEELSAAMFQYSSRLVYLDDYVRIEISSNTLKGLGNAADIELSVELIEDRTISFPSGKAGIVYDITLKVNGMPYTETFVKPIEVYLAAEGAFDPSSVGVYYVNGEIREDMNATYSGGYVFFEPPHLSKYAIIYDESAKVTVNLDGGVPQSSKDGWTYSEGKYVKYFAVGTSVNDVMSDFGQYAKSGCISLSVTGSADKVTMDGLTITVQWMTFTSLALIAVILLIIVISIIAIVKSRSKQ